MALFIDEIEQIYEERERFKHGDMPPMISYFFSFVIPALVLIFSLFVVLPFLRSTFGLHFFSALFISIGVWVVLELVIGEFIALYISTSKPNNHQL
jgi:hypothetical protein